MATAPRGSRSLRWPLLSILLFATVVTACNSPTAPETPEAPDTLRLSSAQVLVGGEVVNGQTMQNGTNHGATTLFRATLTGQQGAPAVGHTVQAQYQTPGGGPGGMMNGNGLMTLYDDGTHGDPVAGDGIYCFEDAQGQFGFHMPWAPAGQYHYEFFGFDHQGHHSNHVEVTVTMTQGTTVSSSLHLSRAEIIVGGQVVNGQTMQPGQMHGNSTFFQATLTGPNGPAPGHTVQVQYQWPGGMGPGMMCNGSGPLYLYDDGTHGDPIAGDGIYCFDDQLGQYGFHMPGARHGQYHYEFFGFDHDDHHSNHVMVTVTVGSG